MAKIFFPPNVGAVLSFCLFALMTLLIFRRCPSEPGRLNGRADWFLRRNKEIEKCQRACNRNGHSTLARKTKQQRALGLVAGKLLG